MRLGDCYLRVAVIVLLGLFLEITVFTPIMAVVFGFDIENDLDAWHIHDFSVTPTSYGTLNRNFANEVTYIQSVTDVYQISITVGKIPSLSAHGGIVGIDTEWLLAVAPNIDIDINAFERGEIALLEDWDEMDAHKLLPVDAMVDIILGDSDDGIPVFVS